MKKVISLALFALLLFSGCSSPGKSASAYTSNTLAAKPKEVYIMSGMIESENQADVTTKISGKVAEISVDVGDAVQKGDPIIQLDTKELQAQVNQAAASVSRAQASFDSTTAEARPEQIDKAQADVDSAGQNHSTAKANFERIQALYREGAAALQQMDTAQTQLAAAEAQYKTAQDQLSILKKGATKETVNFGQKQVLEAQAALGIAKTKLSDGTITAPISGVVTATTIHNGELAAPGAPLVTIVNNGSVSVNAYLPARMAGQVKVGQSVIVKVSEIPDKKLEGEITVVNAEINALNQDILVKIAVPNPNGTLKNGMFAEMALKN